MYQKLMIVGNVGQAPTMRYTPAGKAVTTFSVAVNRRWTNDDGSAGNEVTWFQVSAWGRLAEVCNQYLEKGRQVLIEGRLRPDGETGAPRVWTGNDDQVRASFEVVAEVVKFLGGSRQGQEAEVVGQGELPGTMEAQDIPF